MKELQPWNNEQYQADVHKYRTLMSTKLFLERQLADINEEVATLRSSIMEQVTHSPLDYVPSTPTERQTTRNIERLTNG